MATVEQPPVRTTVYSVVIVTAMIAAKHETVLGKSLWRNHTAATERYLLFLAEAAAGLDFALVDVEPAAATIPNTSTSTSPPDTTSLNCEPARHREVVTVDCGRNRQWPGGSCPALWGCRCARSHR